ncbi:homoserine dehydrogenase [Jannaschia rubra]|uniref:Homoserine dehydrogenase n=1 Tax=Jannaschia rubra TaxID=282197 RepID=A0A0M6XQY3_9RHOB|nr:homoserine dehydrogenase [Jannaschia rubra]CTQ33112.1 Homoserine dehydrogenase [Jannaschia rubra]SFG73798.1 homoserine dehydrogenase [Jannaschia rubra]
MTTPLRLGIAGLGTVGVGVVRIVQDHAAMLTLRTGRDVSIVAVSARDRARDRGVDLSGTAWEDDPVRLARRDDVDIFVELMGGSDGPAKAATEAALGAGKAVVTANKAMLALHGQALAELAEANGAPLRFEAAVAGGIPCIKALTEGLAGNAISRVSGVMNGTCNYILTRMESAGLPYADVFEEARQLGYLEADPTLDVGGIDAGHKLAILSAIAFGTQVDFEGVQLQGIERVSIDDIRRARDMGYRIKLLGEARRTDAGIEQSMRPTLVPVDSPLGQLEGGTNMVVIEGDAVGQIVLRGAGAGEGPTASAVMGDVCDIARGFTLPPFGQPAATLSRPVRANVATQCPHYLRMMLRDEPGALARVATVLGKSGVSIARMRQYDHTGDDAPVLIVTHPCAPGDLTAAIDGLAATGVVNGDPVALQIQTPA